MSAFELAHPFTLESISQLRAGDAVSLSGLVFTGRDRFHKHLAETGDSRADLRDGAIFHCGPIVAPCAVHDEFPGSAPWRIVAAGPTTSIREEPYMPRIIASQGLRVIIGKGGMGEGTTAACRDCGCVYLQAVGGAGAVIAKTIKRVLAVDYMEEFGATEAVWTLEVKNLETICAIDAQGKSLYEAIKTDSARRLKTLLNPSE